MNVPLTPLRFLRYANDQFRNKVGVVCGSERFTYSQMSDRCSRLAGALAAIGAQPGDRVAFLSTNCHRLLEAYYGVLEAECVLLPLNIRLSAQELSFVLNDSKAKFLFFERQFLPLVDALRGSIPSVCTFFMLDGHADVDWVASESYEDMLMAATGLRCDIMRVDEDSLAELFYTSGTSDKPKGVMLSHRNIYLHALSVIAAFQTSPQLAGQMTSETVVLHTIPLFHANGWGFAHTVTLLGGTHVMIHHFNPAEVFELVQREKVWICALVPTMANALVHSPDRSKHDLTSLRSIMIGGAASSAHLVKEVEEKLGGTCISGYGLTETSPVLAFSPLKQSMDWQGDLRHNRQAMTGFAIPGVEIRVIDADENDVRHDGVAIGEVAARGDAVMQGYWGQPNLTEDTLAGGWFHTGDVATIDEEQYVLIVDRKKDIIVSGGENISSLEVEKVLASHPAVFEAVVIPVPDEKWGEVPKAVVVLKPGAMASEGEVLDFCRSRLAHYKSPHSVEFVDSLPKTGTGKLMKKELRERYASVSRNFVS
ncbi:MAG TPA: long-chain-fatty-acid--CoA ligase [Terriglobales bacterium]